MRKVRYGILAAGLALIAATAIHAQPYYGPGMMGGYGPGYGMMGGYGPGPMMGGGYGPGWGMGPGMMGGYGPGWMMGPGMMGGYGGGYGPGGMMQGNGYGGYGPGMMGPGYGGYGPGMMGPGYRGAYSGNQGNLNLTTDQVKSYLVQMIRNPNLKVGAVKEKDADTIVAEIVTKEKDALVQRLEFNRHNGFVQPEE